MVGGLIVHFAARLRDVENVRRKQRIEYLFSAYQVLAQSAHRELVDDRAEAFEDAISDVMLLGNDEQISLTRTLIRSFEQNRRASLDTLLLSLRTALRRELGLPRDALEAIPTLRMVANTRDKESSVTLNDSAEVRLAKISVSTTRAVLAAVSRTQATQPGPSRQSTTPPLDMNTMHERAKEDPLGAIDDAHNGFADVLLNMIGGTDDKGPFSLGTLAEMLRQHREIPESFVRTAEGLDIMWDLAINARDGNVGQPQADEYLGLVAAALYVVSGN
jgi:hypothetical protein